MRTSIPGKVFLIGEYGVLAGLPAWVATVSPRFTFHSGVDAAPGFHPESPAGRLLREESSEPKICGTFIDPWKGLGGFGRSTAEFAFSAYARGMRDPLAVWELYQRVCAGGSESFPPSGADLVAQWRGGVIEWNPEMKSAQDITAACLKLPILLFSATHLENRKTVTHSHLESLSVANSREKFTTDLRTLLAPIIDRAKAGLSENNPFEIGHAFSDYAFALASLGLEAAFVKKEREALSRIPGVLGVKGCGALQTDALLVMVDSLSNGRRIDAIIEYAEREFGLKLLARGLSAEPGIS